MARAPRYTIGQIMLVIAVLAASLALPRLMNSPDRLVVSCIVVVLAALVMINKLIEVVGGKPCPACSRRALRRLARHRHYYRCLECRAQLKRFGFGPWIDASGPEDASRYRRPSEAGVWKEYAVPESLEGSSSGLLLRSKRSGELLGEVQPPPRTVGDRRRLEEAERKVRRFLERCHDGED